MIISTFDLPHDYWYLPIFLFNFFGAWAPELRSQSNLP